MTPRSTPQDAAVATSVVWSHPDSGLWVATGTTRDGLVHFGFIEEVDGGLGGFAAFDNYGQPISTHALRREAETAVKSAWSDSNPRTRPSTIVRRALVVSAAAVVALGTTGAALLP